LRTAQLTNVGNPEGTQLGGIQRHNRAARVWKTSATVREGAQIEREECSRRGRLAGAEEALFTLPNPAAFFA